MRLLALSPAPGFAISLNMLLMDQFNKEPKLKMLICFLPGCLCTLPAVIVQRTVAKPIEIRMRKGIAYTAVFAYMLIGLNEKLSKFIILRYSGFPRQSFDVPFDGIVYSVMVDMGFATLKNIGYVMHHGLGTALLRMFSSAPAYGTYDFLLFLQDNHWATGLVGEGLLLVSAVASFLVALALSRKAIALHHRTSQIMLQI